jgi:hypothetical protein
VDALHLQQVRPSGRVAVHRDVVARCGDHRCRTGAIQVDPPRVVDRRVAARDCRRRALHHAISRSWASIDWHSFEHHPSHPPIEPDGHIQSSVSRLTRHRDVGARSSRRHGVVACRSSPGEVQSGARLGRQRDLHHDWHHEVHLALSPSAGWGAVDVRGLMGVGRTA